MVIDFREFPEQSGHRDSCIHLWKIPIAGPPWNITNCGSSTERRRRGSNDVWAEFSSNQLFACAPYLAMRFRIKQSPKCPRLQVHGAGRQNGGIESVARLRTGQFVRPYTLEPRGDF